MEILFFYVINHWNLTNPSFNTLWYILYTLFKFPLYLNIQSFTIFFSKLGYNIQLSLYCNCKDCKWSISNCLPSYLAEFFTGRAHKGTFMKPPIWNYANGQLLAREIASVRVVRHLQQVGIPRSVEVHTPNVKPCHTTSAYIILLQQTVSTQKNEN